MIAYDGSNTPIVGPTSVSLPTAVDDNVWTLSAASVGGKGATDLMGVEIDFGLQVTGEGSNSDIYDTRLSITAVTPQVVLETNDPTWFSTIGLTGSDVTDGTITLRQREDRGTFTETTMTLTFSGIAYATDVFRAGQQGTGRTAIVIDVEYDNTNAPFAIS